MATRPALATSPWNGYFIKAIRTNTIFPMKWIVVESYETIPNAREEIKAYRDENTRNLTRVTAKGHKTSIKFTVRPLHLADKMRVQKFFRDGEGGTPDSTAGHQRKIQLQYWNDEDNAYKTAYFYRPDITFKIKRATATDIKYDEFEINLIEY